MILRIGFTLLTVGIVFGLLSTIAFQLDLLGKKDTEKKAIIARKRYNLLLTVFVAINLVSVILILIERDKL